MKKVIRTLAFLESMVVDFPSLESKTIALQTALLRHAIEINERRSPPPAPVPPVPAPDANKLTIHEEELARLRDGKIQCIKSVRDRTGLDLKGSKKLVEDWMQANLGFAYWA